MLSVHTLRAAQVLTRHLPRPLLAPMVSVASRGYSVTARDERLIAERNIRRVLGEELDEAKLPQLVDTVFESYGRYWLDSLRLVDLSPQQIDDGFSYEGIHHLTDPIDAGITPVVAMPHLGGWEWAAAWLTKVKGWPVTSVAERLEPPELFEWFLDFRRKLGMHIVAVGPGAAGEVGARLAGGDIVSLLCDRDISGDGIVVEFFGERTRIPGGPAVTALRSGSPLVPAAAFFRGSRCHAVILPAIDTERRGRLREDVTRVTQDLAYSLENLIRRAPQQWHLLQPNWPSDFDALGIERPESMRDL